MIVKMVCGDYKQYYEVVEVSSNPHCDDDGHETMSYKEEDFDEVHVTPHPLGGLRVLNMRLANNREHKVLVEKMFDMYLCNENGKTIDRI